MNTVSKNKRPNAESISHTPSTRVATADGTLLPVCVDLDGTLVKTDTLLETLAIYIKKRPGSLLNIPWWLFNGKANLKRKLAKRVKIDPASLPYNQEVLEYIHEARAKGHDIYLVTGANHAIAAVVVNYLGFFKGVYASSKKINLTGSAKGIALNRIFGRGNYIYLGNSSDDLVVWESAREAVVVNASAGVLSAAQKQGNVSKVIGKERVKPRHLLKAMRIHQWTKNLLLFAPIFLANRIDLPSILTALLAFVSFGLVASAGYVFNDFLDINSDRKHKTKYKRPFASGLVPLGYVPGMFAVLFCAGAALSFLLPTSFSVLVLLYFVSTLTYTLKLKRVAIVDVVSLAFFYSLRLYAGGEANAIQMSGWLFGFSSFFFLSLALVKRTSELKTNIDHKQAATLSRGYLIKDNKNIKRLGKLSGAVSIFIFAYYIFSDTALGSYENPSVLLTVCLLLWFWLARVWRLSENGELDHDPVSFAIRDTVSYAVAAGVAISWLLARGF